MVANVVLMAFDGYGYILAAGGAPWTRGWLFANLALFGQISAVNFLLGLLLLGLTMVRGGWVTVQVVGPLVATVLQVLLYVDRSFYSFYRFHLGGLAVHALWMRGGLATLRVEPSTPGLFAVSSVLLLLAEVVALPLAARRCLARPLDETRLRRRWLALAGVVLLLGVADRTVYAMSDLWNARDVIHSARLVPLYWPLTVARFAHRHAIAPAEAITSSGAGLPHYPRAPLRFDPGGQRPNLVWIVIDSWRADAFNPEGTPHIWRLADGSEVFLHHISGGNSTEFGVFSMFYGLYASAQPSFVAERRGPALFAALQQLGYRFRVLSSLSLSFSDFRRTVFVDVQDAIADDLPGPRAADKDRQVTEEFERFIAGPSDGRPFCAVLILQSTHAGYDFDEATARYQPYSQRVGFRGLGAGEQKLRVYNRYRNAVAYADELVGRVLGTLERRGLFDGTVVLVTGDHGEEFDEHGYWGHNGAFTEEQVHVPLVLRVPGMPPRRRDRLTSHHDLPATILGLLGVRNPPSDYSLGRSLFGADADPHAVVCGADECALIDATSTVTFGIGSRDPDAIHVMDADYHRVRASGVELEKRSGQLLELLAQESAFLR